LSYAAKKEKLILKRASTPWAATHQLADASLLAFTENGSEK
jgi:hypothetical protein